MGQRHANEKKSNHAPNGYRLKVNIKQIKERSREMNNATQGGWRNASGAVWTGRVMSGFFIFFMLGASVSPKFFLPHVSEPIMTELGWPTKYTLLIGFIELVGTLLYAIPRTTVLGAVILMGLLGGAMATQLRVETPLFSHVLFSLYLGLFMWGGLWLRSPKLRTIFPLVRESSS